MQQVSDAVLSGLFDDFGSPITAHLLEETVRQCDVDALDRLQALIEARRATDPGPRRPA